MQITFEQGDRGYTMLAGRLRISQSTYLLVAALVVGFAGGWGAIGFRALIGLAGTLADAMTTLATPRLGVFAGVATIAIGGAAAAWIAARFAPEARGHGVPEVMAAVALRGGIIRPRIILIKALASATTIGFGGAAGREGPIVQIGSTIGSLLGQIVHAPAPIVRTLVACGAAAGISATFNAPIGGVFFASEVILGDFAPRSFAVVVVASVMSAVVGRTVLGNHPSFDASAFTLVSPNEMWLYALLGVICALWATGFVRLLYAFEDAADRVRLPAALKGAVGFGVVGAIGVGAPQILGVGYGAMQHVLDGHVGFGTAIGLAALKPVATSITLAAGGSGGVFAPSLYTGAMLGDAFGRIVHTLFPLWTAAPAAYGLVAMAALFAAAAEAPITAIMIVFEMSGDYTIILPLMIATVIATVLGRRFLGSTVYEMKLIRRGIDWARVKRPHALAHVPVAGVCEPDAIRVEARETAGEAAARSGAARSGVVVLEDGRPLGVVSGAALVAHAQTTPHAAMRDLAVDVPVLQADEGLNHAADLLVDPALEMLPVVDTMGSLLGVITRRGVLEALRGSQAV